MVSVEEAPKDIAKRVTRAITILVQVHRRAGSDAIGSSSIMEVPLANGSEPSQEPPASL